MWSLLILKSFVLLLLLLDVVCVVASVVIDASPFCVFFFIFAVVVVVSSMKRRSPTQQQQNRPAHNSLDLQESCCAASYCVLYVLLLLLLLLCLITYLLLFWGLWSAIRVYLFLCATLIYGLWLFGVFYLLACLLLLLLLATTTTVVVVIVWAVWVCRCLRAVIESGLSFGYSAFISFFKNSLSLGLYFFFFSQLQLDIAWRVIALRLFDDQVFCKPFSSTGHIYLLAFQHQAYECLLGCWYAWVNLTDV